MKLKEVFHLVEDERDVDQFKNDCKHFIENNRELLSQNFYLGRASKNEYETPVFRPERERRHIRGSDALFYFYNRLKPENVPSREKQVPCTGGSVSDRFEGGHSNTYSVFPVGSSYKMVYTEGVPDFNYPEEGKPFSLRYTFEDDFNDLPLEKQNQEKIFERAKNVMQEVRHLTGSNEPKKIMEAFDKLISFVNRNKKELKPEFENTIQSIEKYKEYYNQYFFPKTNVETELKMEMDGLEVGLYAPNGFYYLTISKLDKIF